MFPSTSISYGDKVCCDSLACASLEGSLVGWYGHLGGVKGRVTRGSRVWHLHMCLVTVTVNGINHGRQGIIGLRSEPAEEGA
jgi:hypothetical protein